MLKNLMKRVHLEYRRTILKKCLRYQAGILGHSMTEMKAFFTSDFNTLKIRSMVFRLAFRISVKKVVHCNVIFYKYHVEDVRDVSY